MTWGCCQVDGGVCVVSPCAKPKPKLYSAWIVGGMRPDQPSAHPQAQPLSFFITLRLLGHLRSHDFAGGRHYEVRPA